MRANERRLTKKIPVKHIFHQMSSTHNCLVFFKSLTNVQTRFDTKKLLEIYEIYHRKYDVVVSS